MAKVKVRDRKTGLEREVTLTAYNLRKSKYILLDASPNLKPQQQSGGEKVVVPVGDDVVKVDETPETVTEDSAQTGEIAEVTEVKAKGKPGRKPKSISSPSVEAEK